MMGLLVQIEQGESLVHFFVSCFGNSPKSGRVVVKRGITMKTRKSYHCPLYCGRKIGYTVIATNELAV